VVKGGASVRLLDATAPVPAAVDSGPIVPEAQAVRAGLFQPRLVEFGEARRETIVSARPQVREELVVGRSVDSRPARIDDTVRRTEVEIENLPPRAARELSGEPSEGE
jgi:hypothetical protein